MLFSMFLWGSFYHLQEKNKNILIMKRYNPLQTLIRSLRYLYVGLLSFIQQMFIECPLCSRHGSRVCLLVFPVLHPVMTVLVIYFAWEITWNLSDLKQCNSWFLSHGFCGQEFQTELFQTKHSKVDTSVVPKTGVSPGRLTGAETIRRFIHSSVW